MINKLKWILMLFAFPSVCYSNVPCNPSSWEDNLNEFNRLESKYNKHVKVFNALLIEHKQRPLLSKEFSPDELALLWRVKQRRDMLQTQLEASIKYRQELTQKASEITRLSTQSKWSANGWGKLAQSCKMSDNMSNHITADWYHSNANQLAEDFTKLSSLYLGLAAVYDREATELTSAQHKINTNSAKH
ncbi:MAG: ATPase [Vibrionaceae bacterium]|nr:ATPase [Vibrionaceae bacterium]